MEIKVIRKYKKDTYCIGEMLVNGEHFCNTLEDKDRGLSSDMTLSQIKKIKIYAKTAIPYGTYNVTVYFWPKYRKNYPLLHDVKGFTGILVHCGRTANDSAGCILVGENKIKGGLVNGEKYIRKLTTMCEDAIKLGEKVTITICD
jgi:hypothetical protein